MKASDIVFHGVCTSVRRTPERFELCVELESYAVVVGYSPDKDKCVKTAKALDRYPENARAYARIDHPVRDSAKREG